MPLDDELLLAIVPLLMITTLTVYAVVSIVFIVRRTPAERDRARRVASCRAGLLPGRERIWRRVRDVE